MIEYHWIKIYNIKTQRHISLNNKQVIKICGCDIVNELMRLDECHCMYCHKYIPTKTYEHYELHFIQFIEIINSKI